MTKLGECVGTKHTFKPFFFFEEIKMGYINNGDESSLVQVVS